MKLTEYVNRKEQVLGAIKKPRGSTKLALLPTLKPNFRLRGKVLACLGCMSLDLSPVLLNKNKA